MAEAFKVMEVRITTHVTNYIVIAPTGATLRHFHAGSELADAALHLSPKPHPSLEGMWRRREDSDTAQISQVQESCPEMQGSLSATGLEGAVPCPPRRRPHALVFDKGWWLLDHCRVGWI